MSFNVTAKTMKERLAEWRSKKEKESSGSHTVTVRPFGQVKENQRYKHDIRIKQSLKRSRITSKPDDPDKPADVPLSKRQRLQPSPVYEKKSSQPKRSRVVPSRTDSRRVPGLQKTQSKSLTSKNIVNPTTHPKAKQPLPLQPHTKTEKSTQAQERRKFRCVPSRTDSWRIPTAPTERKEGLDAQKATWREERRKRLAARLLKNNPNLKMSEAVFGVDSRRFTLSTLPEKPEPQVPGLVRRQTFCIGPPTAAKGQNLPVKPAMSKTEQSTCIVAATEQPSELAAHFESSEEGAMLERTSSLRSRQKPVPSKLFDVSSKTQKTRLEVPQKSSKQLNRSKSQHVPISTTKRADVPVSHAAVAKKSAMVGARRSLSTIHREIKDPQLAHRKKQEVFTSFMKSQNSSFTAIQESSTPAGPSGVSFTVPSTRSSSKKLLKTPTQTPKEPSLRKKLSDWLDKKGHTVANYRHLHCFGVQLSEVKKFKKCQPSATATSGFHLHGNVDETEHMDLPPPPPDMNDASPVLQPGPSREVTNSSSVRYIEEQGFHFDFQKTLAELLGLLEMGYPPEEVTKFLDELINITRLAKKHALYWECRARVAELQGDVKAAVGAYDEAIAANAQPKQDVQNYLKEFVIRCPLPDSQENVSQTSASVQKEKKKKRLDVDTTNVFRSTLRMFMIHHNTPSMQRLQNFLGIEKYKITPVRRSARKSCFVDPTRCVSSLSEVSDAVKKSAIYCDNGAFKV